MDNFENVPNIDSNNSPIANTPMSPVPLPPERHSARFVVIVLMILVLIAAGVLFFLAFKKQPPQKPSVISNTNTQQKPSGSKPAMSVEQQNAYILSKTKILFPAVITKTPLANSADLPPELQKLIPTVTTGLEINKVNYNNKTTGYLIVFDLKGSPFENNPVLRSTIVAAGFQVTNSVRGDELGFYEFANSAQQARFLFSSKPQNITNVQFQSIIK